MKVIPVIDLMRGNVVHARRGERSRYRPLESKLVSGSDPEHVVEALLDFYPFETLYLADLDAIQQTGNHFSTIEQLAVRFSEVEFWVDAGIACKADIERWTGNLRPVIGSESLRDCSILGPEVIFSLDFKDDQLLGRADLLSARWPDDVIVMTLDRVGSALGPDFAQLERVKKLIPEKRCYCAGGVRNVEDLRDLKERDIDGALIASALHDRSLSSADLASFCFDPVSRNNPGPANCRS